MIENLKDNGIDVKKLFILLFFLMVLFIIFIYNVIPRGYLIIDESLILTKRGGKWSQVYEVNNDILSKKYNVATSDGKSKNVILNYTNNSWYYMNKNYKDLDLSMVRVAYTRDYSVKVANYSSDFYSDSDDVFLKNILGDKSIDSFKSSLIKSSFDLDNDGKLEVIYTLSNESIDFNANEKYSTIFLVKDNNLIGRLDKDTNKPFLVQDIADIDGDGRYEVIVSKGTIDVATFDTCYQIYSINGKKIKKIKDC